MSKSAIVPCGLLDPARPYADLHFKDGYGYWNYRGGPLFCWLHGHRWKWCFSTVIDGQQQWHLQCVRCRRQEKNPREVNNGS
jgi:hypothetical protein